MKLLFCLLLACAGIWIALLANAMPALSFDEVTSPEEVAELQQNAQNGDADAQYNLGMLYQKGDGVQQDDIKAVYWFRKSAEQGDSDGQYALGFAYRGGFGVPIDHVQSYMWFDLAARQGNDSAASIRSNLAELMTYAEISQARALSRSWKPQTNEASTAH